VNVRGRHDGWTTRLPYLEFRIGAAAEPEEMCLKEQYYSIGVCRKTQESEEWRKGEMGGAEELLGKEGLQKIRRVARLVQVQWG
jgi:hypothetical protein